MPHTKEAHQLLETINSALYKFIVLDTNGIESGFIKAENTTRGHTFCIRRKNRQEISVDIKIER